MPPFQTLLDDHGRDVMRLLVALVGREGADDVYQETWLAALRAYTQLHDGSNLRAWIMTIARHKAMDHFRAATRRPIPVEQVPDAPAPADVPPPGSDDADRVWADVGALPPKMRAAVALRYVADASYPEIAAALECSEAAARRSVFEGLKRLREVVER